MRYALCIIVIGGVKPDPASAIAHRNGFWNLFVPGAIFTEGAFFVKRVAKYHRAAFAVVWS